nr:DUF2306 domain-containing protein [Orrella marina]
MHTALAAVSLLSGALLLWGRKGNRAHQIAAWGWVICMAAVAGSSFAIYGPDGYSWIHGLSVLTLLMLATGVMRARSHNIAAHRANMISLYVGALVITGLFTLLPGRLLGNALWGWLG